MSLNEDEINLLNNISENETYLEDSGDDVKDQLFEVIEHAAYEQLNPEEQAKLYNGNSLIFHIVLHHP